MINKSIQIKTERTVVMKKILFFLFVFTIAFLIIGEVNIFRLNFFTNEITNTTVYLQDYQKLEDMIDDIVLSAEKHDVTVFVKNETIYEGNNKEIAIWGSELIKEDLNEIYNIEPTTYKSLFLGDVSIKMFDFNEITDDVKINIIYIIGTDSNAQSFKMELIDKYAGNHPVFGRVDSSYKYIIISVWIIVGILVFLQTLYYFNVNKKEMLVNITLGESKVVLIIKNIMFDLLQMTIAFFLSQIFLFKFTNPLFYYDISIISFFVIWLISSTSYIKINSCNIKEAFSNVYSKNITDITLITKTIVIVVTSLILSTNFVVIIESINYLNQKNFYKQNSEYEFLDLSYKLIIDQDGNIIGNQQETTDLNLDFYINFYDEFKPLALVSMDYTSYPMIYANSNAIEYLNLCIGEDVNFKAGFTLLIPSSRYKSVDNYLIDSTIDLIKRYNGINEEIEVDIINYNGAEILAFDEMVYGRSYWHKDPIIVVENVTTSYMKSTFTPSLFRTNIQKDIIYQIDDDIFQQFLEDNDLLQERHNRVNIMNNFDEYKTKWLYLLVINVVFSIIVVGLTTTTTITLIRIQYKVNAMEIAIKKIHGFSLIERHMKIFRSTLVSLLISAFISVILGIVFGVSSVFSILLGVVLLGILEYIVLIFRIQLEENQSIVKIFKGGVL